MADDRKKISRQRIKELRKRLKDVIKPKIHLVYLAAFLSWCQFLMRILSFTLIAKVIADLYQQVPISFTLVVSSLCFLTVLGLLLSLSAKKLQGLASQYARNQLKEEFFQAFYKREKELTDSQTAADILTVASQGIDSLDTYYSYYLSLNLRTYFNCGTIFAIVAYIFPVGAGIFLLSLPLIPISIMMMQRRSQKIMDRYWSSYMDVGNLFLDDLKGLNTLFSYQADEKYEKEFAEQAEDFRDATMELLSFQLQSLGYMDAVMYLGIGVSAFVALVFLSAGNLSLFTIIYFILIATEFFTPIREAGYGMHLVMMNTKMADRIFSFLDSIKTTGTDDGHALFPFDELKVEELSFSYSGYHLLDSIDFTVKKGEILAIAGESGRGKTTLANLLLGKMTVQEGQIWFGRQEIQSLNQETLFSEIVYVSSDSVLLNTSILDNLRLGTDMTRAEIEAWLEKQKVLTFLSNLPEGIDTIVGEDGKLLSSGQRQQIICVRALLAKRSLYIFDEITSSVDRENEAFLYELIALISRQAIVVEITHKMKQVKKADKVLFIGEKGTYVGSPQQLYQEEEYRELADTQERLEELTNGNQAILSY